MASIPQSAILEMVKALRLFESKQSKPENVGNWITQVLGNDRLKNKVDVSTEFDAKKLVFSIENFQPARVLDSKKPDTLWANVVEVSPSDYLSVCESGSIPKAIETQEAFALIAYFTTLNLFGKPLSATSGGRAYIANRMLDTLKPKSFALVVNDVNVGGNKKESFSFTLDLPDVKRICAGGLWRANLVIALPQGKRATSSNNRPVVVGW